jgi:1-acyl-sn-glycerol-3-phosphate acyltransferase
MMIGLARAVACGGWLLQRGVGRRRPRDPLAAARGLSELVGQVGRRHGLEIEVRGWVPAHPCVVVANHLSYLDPIALLSLLPALPVCKAEVAGWPVLGPRVRASGVLLVDRTDPWSGARVLRRMRAALAAGASVLVFPEGTTTAGDRVLPFRRGAFGIARRAGVPIAPAALRYRDPRWAWTGGDRFLPHYLRAAAAGRIQVQVAFGPLIHPDADAEVDDLAELAHSRVVSLVRRLHDAPADRVRVPAPRPDAVLSAARR